MCRNPLRLAFGFPESGSDWDGWVCDGRRREVAVAEPSVMSFAGLLRQLRVDAGLTQEELAEAARLSLRAVSDLERGVNRTARKDTARLLADALNLAGSARVAFEASARGRDVAAGWLATVVPAGGLAGATRTLPRDVVSFTGREADLHQLVASAAGPAGVVSICAVGGMAGIGKTAFAVHAAHLLAARFPDGQVFLPLHGHTPGQRPVDPADALASLLLTAGVGVRLIPPGVEARARLWRDHLADKLLLLVLDDAAGHEQVRPLLPGAGGSLVLITSRRHLTALEDARMISLDTLAPGEAEELLIRRADRADLDPGDPTVGEITRLCGFLPLAIGMLARQLHHHPSWTAAGLAADLAAARDRLDLMHAEDLSVAAAFDLSYRDLADGQQVLFRRLGLHPGTDIDAYAAAALVGADLAVARHGLNVLYDQYLLAEPAPGRYRMHDLIREHARALAVADQAQDRDNAGARLLGYYLHAARSASCYLGWRSPGAVLAVAGSPPASAPELPTREDAVAWMEAERLNLHAAATGAARDGQHSHATAIAAAMHGFLRGQGHWDQAIGLHEAALGAARRAGDLLAEAAALTTLADMQELTGDQQAAAAGLSRALCLSRQVGDHMAEASVLNELGTVQQHAGDYPAAAASHEQALQLYRDAASQPGEASALNELGAVQQETGDYPAAAASHEEALRLYRALGKPVGAASALNRIGCVQQVTGNYPAAAASHEEALRLYRRLGYPLGEASALLGMADVQLATGNFPAAAASLATALQLNRDLGYRNGEARSLDALSKAQRSAGDCRAATASVNTALALFRSIGHLLGEANALTSLAVVQQATGDYSAATASLTTALDKYRRLRARNGEAKALNAMGALLLSCSAPADALPCYEQALKLAASISSQTQEAAAREGIGRCHLHDSRPGPGVKSLRQALVIYQRIGSPNAEHVRKIITGQQERDPDPADTG
jgi:tetratricopeptide (TPR) repeat protein/DNA-binding XRE family transcriptional regulator